MIKTIFLSILTALFIGIVTFFWSTVSNVNALTTKIYVVESKVETNDKKICTMEKMIQELHWFFIKRNNVIVPKTLE